MYLFLARFALYFIATCYGAAPLSITQGIGDTWLDYYGCATDHGNLWIAINELKQTSQAQLDNLNEKINQQKEILARQPQLCQGRTNYTQWKPYWGSHGISAHVDTSHCRFQAVPAYFTSLSGYQSHWTTIGMTSIYAESKSGFDVYLMHTEGAKDTNDVCLSPYCIKAANYLLESIDETIDPCEDFYQFACGTWLKNTR
ncbi:unnamed protein product, partial [Adineta steineri]